MKKINKFNGKSKFLNKKLIIKLLILIVLILLIFTTSFRSGEKFYVLKNTYLGDIETKIESGLARWKFNARVVYINEVNSYENN